MMDWFGIWLHDADPIVDQSNWDAFQSAVNSGGLSWEFSKRSKSVVFIDMTIEIEDGKIVTSLYAKPLALYLYIPPHSCHAPGVHTGHRTYLWTNTAYLQALLEIEGH